MHRKRRVRLLSRSSSFCWSEVHLELTLSIDPSRQEIIQKTTEAIQQLARAFSYIFSQAIVQKAVNNRLDRVVV
jgi:hypothetical protein